MITPGQFDRELPLTERIIPKITPELGVIPPASFIRQPAPERVGSPRPAAAVRPGVGPMETSILVFIVEDEQPIRDLLEEALEDGGFAVATAAAG